jgi:hypothetical protein
VGEEIRGTDTGGRFMNNFMRRPVLFSILLCGLTMGLFSLDFSVGGGVALVPYTEGLDITAPRHKDAFIRNHWADWGAYAFFDAQYLEAGIGYYKAFFGNYEQSSFGGPLDLKSEYENIGVSYLDLGLSLKYPVKGYLGSNLYVLTPLLGFNYWINTRTDYGYKTAVDAALDLKKKDWDQMWIKAGFSFDRYYTQKFYTRFAIKLAFPLRTNDWEDRGNSIEGFFKQAITGVNASYGGIGGDFSLALGYRIK